MSSSESVPVALSQKSKTCLPSEAVVQWCSVKKVFWEISQNSQKNPCARVSFSTKLQASNFIRKETLAQVFSCEFCEISKNTFSYRTPPVAASVKATHTNNKINSNYLGDKLFLKNVYIIKVLAHWCVQVYMSFFTIWTVQSAVTCESGRAASRKSVYFGISKLILYFPYFMYHVLYYSLCTFAL